jgi:hypothetical protein
VSRIAETVKARELAKQEKYLKIARRFLAEATSDNSEETTERHDSSK